MKTNLLFAILALIFVVGCQPKAKEKQEKEVKQERAVDLESLKDSISLVMDNYYEAYNSKDLETYSNLLAEDGLFCGTDPGEFWNKKDVVDMVRQQFADTTFNW
ncbi:MAG: nuclear transport factor 2 family protein [Gillisia sp.]